MENSSVKIRAKGVSKSYQAHRVLTGVDLEVIEGQTLGILGLSGSGKSVLLRLLLGLERPDSGSIQIDGVEITGLKGRALFEAVKQTGMLFQAGALFDSLTIYENTAFYLRNHPDLLLERFLTKEEIDQRVLEAIALVGLKEAGPLFPADLSGGMRKRAALARLIAYRPKILLYDEPTTGLDPITAMQINDLIIQTQKELKATSIVVTHDLCSAFCVANTLAFVHEGTIRHHTSKERFAQIEDPLVQSFLKNSIPQEIL